MSFLFTAAAVAVPFGRVLFRAALWNRCGNTTGGYLARWYEGHLEESRSTAYGLYLVLTARPDFWPAVAAQALVTVWVLWLTLRAHEIATPLALVATATVLSILTSLSWIASTLLTDVFTGLSVLALYLVTLRAETLARWERGALIVLIAFAAATHTATLAVLLALLTAGLIALAARHRAVRSGAPAPRSALRCYFAARRGRKPARSTPAERIPFGRMLQSGIVAHYLADHCPDPRLTKLCANRDKLPTDTDFFFWGSDLFDELGRFEGLGEEMRIVVRESLTEYPAMQIKSAIAATAKQLVRVATGYGVHTEIWHTTWIIEQFAPAAVPAMKAARQQQGNLDFAMINRLHVPIAWASMLLLIGVLALSWRRPQFQNVSELAAVVTLAILANAAVCGALANPHDRYGARIVWLATLVVWIVAWRAISTAGSHRARIS
jgi:hypothetical protein